MRLNHYLGRLDTSKGQNHWIVAQLHRPYHRVDQPLHWRLAYRLEWNRWRPKHQAGLLERPYTGCWCTTWSNCWSFRIIYSQLNQLLSRYWDESKVSDWLSFCCHLVCQKFSYFYFFRYPLPFYALMSAPMNASAAFIIKDEIRWNEEAENIKNDIVSVNIKDVFEFRGRCASIFLLMTWCNLRSQRHMVLMQIHRSNRSKYS